MLEQLIGDNLQVVEDRSFALAYYLKKINLKNVVEIGLEAFYGTSLREIQNNHI